MVGRFPEPVVVKSAACFNTPLLVCASTPGSLAVSCFSVSTACDGARGVVIDTIKMSEEGSDCIVVRLYESLGGRGTVRLQWCAPKSAETARW